MTPSTGKEARIRALIEAITAHLRADQGATEGTDRTLTRLASTDFRSGSFADQAPVKSRHDAVLRQGIANIPAGSLAGIRSALVAATDDLAWQEDDMKYYPAGADLGAGYGQCNLHSLLVGPGACGFHHDDFSLGIFVLGPRTLYRDHRHDAPETYINLSTRTGWRFDGGSWADYQAGSIIFNPPNAVHATRVYDQPFVSVFSWLENIDGQCSVVPHSDWALIEANLEIEKSA